MPCFLQDGAVGAVDLTGAVIGGEIWLACYRVSQPLSVANGAIVRIADAGGRFTMAVPRLLTANAAVDAVRLPVPRPIAPGC